MLLAIDVGNTNIVFAVYNGREQVKCWRCQTVAGRTSDEYASWLYQLFESAGLQFDIVTNVIVSSVVPDANYDIKAFCQAVFHCDVRFIDHEMSGLKIELDNPREAGADRLADAVAVIKDYPVPAVIVDFGTATNFEIIDAKERYLGGVIVPGVGISMEALHQAAAKLPKVGIEEPEKVVGRNTIEAMQSGVYWGYISMIEGMVARIKKEMGEDNITVIATGGLASLFAQGTDIFNHVDIDLTLKGLVYIDEEQNQRV